MKKQIGGIVNPCVVGGVSSNRPPTRAEQAGKLELPSMNDKTAIELQRQQLRQEEANRANRQNG